MSPPLLGAYTSLDEVRSDHPGAVLTDAQCEIRMAMSELPARFLALPAGPERDDLMRTYNALGVAARAGLTLADVAKGVPLPPLKRYGDDGEGRVLETRSEPEDGAVLTYNADLRSFDVITPTGASPTATDTTPMESRNMNPTAAPEAPEARNTVPAVPGFDPRTAGPSTPPVESRYGAPLTGDAGFAHLPESRSHEVDTTVLGEYLAGTIHGRYTERAAALANEARAQNEGTGTAGGFVVPVALSATVLDAVRRKAAVMQAGALTVPMASNVQDLAKLDTDPVPAWRSESAPIAEGSGVFGKTTFTARSLAVLVKASWELVADSTADLGAIMQNAMAQAIALEIDRVALYGTGTAPQPKGVKNFAGVAKTALATNGAAPTWKHLLAARARLEGRDYTPTGVILNPRTDADLAGQTGTDGHFVQAPAYVAEVPRFASSGLSVTLTQGTANNASDIFMADWGFLGIGVRSTLEIVPLRERYADTGEIAWVAYVRADVQTIRDGAFEVLTGAIPAP